MYMKKETSAKKGKLWLIIAIALVAVLAVAGVILALTLGGGEAKEPEEQIESKLYWNIDRVAMVDKETQLTLRKPAADGLYYIRFAVDGEQVELPCADKKLVNRIDLLGEVVGLKFDADGIIIEAYNAKDFATAIVENAYVQNVDGNMITTNSSMTLNGMEVEMDMSNANIYIVEDPRPEVSGRDFTIGAKDELKLMDTIIAFGDEEGVVHTVYITNRLYDSKVYWRVSAQEYDSTNKVSSRKLQDDGYWYMDFLCEGEIVTVRTADQACINAMDGYAIVSCACGLVFDKNGDVVDVFNAGLAVKGSVAANNYDVTAIDGTMVTLSRKLAGTEQGRTYMLNVTEDLPIYNVTTTADKFGELTDLQIGDRVYLLADSTGKPVQAYITCRLVDSPMYYNISPSYNAETKETNRKPDADGWYTIQLAVGGKLKEFRCKDKALMTQIDAYGNKVFGLKLKGDRIVKVYNPECVTGAYSFAANNWVTSIAGGIVGTTNASGTAVNGIMDDACEVYDVSGCSDFLGAKTTLREGDRILAYNTPDATMRYIYIISRKVDGASLYWNFEKKYNAATGLTTRTPDADGYYVFRMAKCGTAGEKLMKTKDIEIASKIDKTGVYALCMKTKGDIIQKVYPATAINAGYSRIYGIYTTQRNDDTHYGAKFYTTGAEANIDISLAKIYNVSGVYKKGAGENTSLQPNDRLMLLYGQSGKAEHIIVWERECGSSAYWQFNPNYNAQARTTEPDENGYYNYTVTSQGKIKNVKTKDKELAAYMDGRFLAFGLKLKGDIITGAYGAVATKEIAASAQSFYDVAKISGNKITLERTVPGSSNTGDVQEINISKAKVYNVSAYAGDAWGKTAKLGVGDRVQTYKNEKDEITLVYIVWENTHEAGHKSYCEHCKKTVVWHPYYGTIDFIDKHYYLPADYQNKLSKGWGIQGATKGYDWVLDLNGFTYEATDSYAFAVRGNSTLTVMDTSKAKTGRITGVGVQIKDAEGNKSQYQSSQAGIFQVLDNGTLNLRGGTYTRTVNRDITNLRRAGVAMVNATGTLNIYDGAKLVNNTMDVPLDLTASEPHVEIRRAPQGGAIYNNGGVVNIYGGEIANNGKIHKDFAEFEGTAVGNGGNIFNASGELNIYGGKITGGWSRGNGGNIYVTSGKLTIAGGEISGATSVGGANNIIVAANNNTEINISGGKITGDVTVLAGNTLKLSGKPVISKGEKQGLFLAEGVKAQVGTMKSGAKIVISSTGIFTTDFKTVDAAKTAKAYFVSADKEIPISVIGKALACGIAKCLNGHTNTDQCDAENCQEEMLFWQPWKDGASLPTAGNYYLTKNVTVDSTTAVSGALVLDLNGFNVTRNVTEEQAKSGSSQPVFNAAASSKLVIADLSGKAVPGTVKAVLPKDGSDNIIPVGGTQGLVTVSSGATVAIYGGIFDGKDMLTSSANAGGIFCGGGNLTIYGGEFYGWSNAAGANDGIGSIFGGWSTSVLTINGGTFYGGTTKQGGMFASTGKIVINGGLFDGNNSASNTAVDASKPRTVATHGGLILVQNHANASLEINGGTFKAGQGFNSGGMIYVEANNASTVTINGGTFQASSKAQNGGFIRFRGKDLNISGVTLEGFAVSNAANADIISFEGSGKLTVGKDAVIAGGVMVKSASKLILKDNVKINNGAAYAIKLAAGASMDLNGLNDSAKVYVNHTEVGVAFAEVKDAATAQKLVANKIVESADENYVVISDGNKLTVKVNTDFKNWTSDNTLPTSGKYRLTKDVTIDARVNLTGDLVLDLNGKNITRVIKADATDYGVYTTNGLGNLHITDLSGNPGTVKTVFDTGVTTCSGTGFLIYVGTGFTGTIDNGIFDFRGVKTTNAANTGCGPIVADGKVIINGGTFYGTTASSGCGALFSGRSASTLTVNGGTFVGGTANQGGILYSTGKIVVNGGTLIGGSATRGGLIYTKDLEITDGMFDGNNDGTDGKVNANYPASVVGAHAGLIRANGKINISGGTFQNGYAKNAAGILWAEGAASEVTITGGTFQNAKCGTTGGHMRLDGTATITGATLKGGSAGTVGSAIAFCSNKTLTIGKNAVIEGGVETRQYTGETDTKIVLKDNVQILADSNGKGVLLVDTTLDISGLNDQAKVAVNHTDPATAFAVAADEATAQALVNNQIIVSGDSNYRVIADGKNLTVKVQIQWNEWNATTAANAYGGTEADKLHLTKLPTSGDWKLSADVTIDARVAMNGNLNLNLNGFTVTRVIKASAADYGVYTTNAKGNLYITDEIQLADPNATVGTMTAVFDTGVTTCAGTGFLGYVGTGYSITIDEGNFDFRGVKTTASATTGAGAIIVDGTLTINGGTFYGANCGTTGYGTVIGGRSAGIITINGGAFYGNNAKQGGIISTTGNLTINGGLFDGNTNTSNGKANADLPQSVATHGGLFYVAKALTITGGEFKAGRVSGSGGVAYVTGSGSVISGGTYTAGGQTNYAGFFRFDGSATITGVTLSGGKATTNGNNIAFGSNGNATLTIGQDAVIDGGIMFRTDKTGNKLVLLGNAQVNGGTGAAYSLNLANATVHIGDVANAPVATVGSTFTNYIATYDAAGNVTGVQAK